MCEPMQTMHDLSAFQENRWDLELRGINYKINVAATRKLLLVKLEDMETNERWSAEFTSQQIEDKTASTGSFIDFDAFVKTLCCSLSKVDESIVANIITSTELQAIKARRKAAPTTSPPLFEGSVEKRYVITTVVGSIKPVHYSLTLEPEDADEENVVNLRQVIARLRGKIAVRDNEKNKLIKEQAELRKQVDTLKKKTEGNTARVITELRGQLAKAQQELRAERQNTSLRGWGSNSNNHAAHNRCHSADRARTHSPATGRDVRDNYGLSRGDWRKAPDRTNASRAGPRSASPNLTRPNNATPRSREVSPSLRARGGTPTNAHNTFSNISPARRGSPAAASTLGGRFDPTAYQREKASRERAVQQNKSWGAGSGRYRHSSPSREESGYISGGSQSSRGSRRSQRSNSTKGSQGSHQPDSRKKKTSKKEAAAPSLNNRWTEESNQTKKSAPAPASCAKYSPGIAVVVLSPPPKPRFTAPRTLPTHKSDSPAVHNSPLSNTRTKTHPNIESPYHPRMPHEFPVEDSDEELWNSVNPVWGVYQNLVDESFLD